jgi:hypothetical protein
VDRSADAEGEEPAPAALHLPACVQVGLAGVAREVDGGAERRPDRAEQDRQRWPKDDFEVEIDGGGLLAAAGQGKIVHLCTDLELSTATFDRPFLPRQGKWPVA